MTIPLLTTKLQIPPVRTNYVQRPRLLARLQQGLDRKLILVSAPAGYGKTTLISGWLARCKLPAAWVSLDPGDNDPARFWAYIAASMRPLFPSLEQMTPESPGEARMAELINAVDGSARPILLVLDDYHHIESRAIHEGLSYLLDHAPASLHVVIATRADPPLPVARLRACSQLIELRLADLRFTAQEIPEFLSQRMGLHLSETDLSLLENSTEGWVAGLQMAALSLQGREDIPGFIRSFSGEDRYVLDFLFEEVLQRQPPTIQSFLLQTSILDRLSSSLCESVTLLQNSQPILEALERNNLFLIALDEQRQWYRFHHLFADLLSSRLKQTAPGSIALLHQRASSWYLAENDLENAIAHSLAAGDFELAAALIEQIIQKLDRHNKQAMLTGWLDRLPREVLETRPWLCVHRAWGYYWTGRREQEEEWLRLAEKSIEQNLAPPDLPEKRHLEGHIAAVRALVALTAENIPRVLETAHQALELLPDGDEMRCETSIALGGAYWALGDVDRSEQAFAMAQAQALRVGPTLAVPSTCYAGIQKVKRGRLQDAIDTYSYGLRLAALPDGSETPIASVPNLRLGDVWREKNDLASARQYLNRGLKQALQLGQPDVITEAYVYLGRYALAVGDLESAHAAMKNADGMAREIAVDPFLLGWLEECRLQAWHMESNLNAIQLWIRDCGLSPDEPFNYLHDLHHQNLARALAAQDLLTGSMSSQETASRLLGRLEEAAGQAGWIHEEIKILLLQALHFHAQGMGAKARQSLARAVSLAEPGGYVRVFLNEGKTIQGLLAAVLNNLRQANPAALYPSGAVPQGEQLARLRSYVSGLLSAFSFPADSGPLDRASLSPMGGNRGTAPGLMVEPLSERELEVLSRLSQGCSDKEIAQALVIANGTVHKHLKNIYGKLGVHSRIEALVRARELGLL